ELDRLVEIVARRDTRRSRTARVLRPRELTYAVRIARGHLRGVEAQRVVENLRLALPDRAHLCDLLLERHAREEILDAHCNVESRVLVVLRACAEHERKQCRSRREPR